MREIARQKNVRWIEDPLPRLLYAKIVVPPAIGAGSVGSALIFRNRTTGTFDNFANLFYWNSVMWSIRNGSVFVFYLSIKFHGRVWDKAAPATSMVGLIGKAIAAVELYDAFCVDEIFSQNTASSSGPKSARIFPSTSITGANVWPDRRTISSKASRWALTLIVSYTMPRCDSQLSARSHQPQ